MKTHGTGHVLFSYPAVEVAGQPDLRSFPLLRDLITSMKPELLDGSPRSNALLKSILVYVFESHSNESIWLKNQLDGPLYDALFGLKFLIRKTGNINRLTLALDEHKRRFARFLEED
jgi:hypothetical protein